jgi:hypothetical protein
MGLRFRKRIALGKLARINLSKSAVSLGFGPPGLNVNFSTEASGLSNSAPIPDTVRADQLLARDVACGNRMDGDTHGSVFLRRTLI